VLTFPNALPKDATASLRAAEQLAVAHGGTARRVAPLPASDKSDTAAA
jgi:hypothetical protein